MIASSGGVPVVVHPLPVHEYGSPPLLPRALPNVRLHVRPRSLWSLRVTPQVGKRREHDSLRSLLFVRLSTYDAVYIVCSETTPVKQKRTLRTKAAATRKRRHVDCLLSEEESDDEDT